MDTLDETTDEWAAAKDKYINAIKAIFQELNNQITNGQGLNFVEEE